MNPQTILIIIALILAIISIIKPAYPLLHVAVMPVCIALLIGWWKP